MSALTRPLPLPRATFLVPIDSPRPAYRGAQRRRRRLVGPGRVEVDRVVATARANLADWGRLDAAGQRRLVRDLGLLLAVEVGGISGRQLRAILSESGVRKSLRSLRACDAPSEEDAEA